MTEKRKNKKKKAVMTWLAGTGHTSYTNFTVALSQDIRYHLSFAQTYAVHVYALYGLHFFHYVLKINRMLK